jgi:hypothetical protein
MRISNFDVSPERSFKRSDRKILKGDSSSFDPSDGCGSNFFQKLLDDDCEDRGVEVVDRPADSRVFISRFGFVDVSA